MVSRIVLGVLLLLFAGCYRTSAMEAERLAEARLNEYAAKVHVNRALFGVATISIEPDGRQVFDYTSQTAPKHLVRIYVHKNGRVEMHRMIETTSRGGQAEYCWEVKR